MKQKQRRIKGPSTSLPPKPQRTVRVVGREVDIRPESVAANIKHRLSTDEKAVIRDIWVYSGILFLIGATISLAFAGFALDLLGVIALACGIGAIVLHIDTIDRFARAHREGLSPDLTRVF